MHMYSRIACMHAESVYAGDGVRVGSVVGLVRVVWIVSDVGLFGCSASAMMHSFARILSSLSQAFSMLMTSCPILTSMSTTTSIRVINRLKMLITCKMWMSMSFITCPMLITCETSTSVPVKRNKECQKCLANHFAHDTLLTIAAGILTFLSEACHCWVREWNCHKQQHQCCVQHDWLKT